MAIQFEVFWETKPQDSPCAHSEATGTWRKYEKWTIVHARDVDEAEETLFETLCDPDNIPWWSDGKFQIRLIDAHAKAPKARKGK